MMKHQLVLAFCTAILLAAILLVKFCDATDPDPLPGNYTFSGMFSFHSSDGTLQQGCGAIDTQNAILYFEAFRFAINYINNLNITPYKIGYNVFDTCDSSLKLKGIIKEQCMQQYNRGLVALIGPSSSDAALEVSSVFDIWGINTVSYGAASPIFDDRSVHKKFLRTVPSDSYQISAMIDIIRYFNWTYIVALSSCSNYEQKVLNIFDEKMLADKRCLGRKSTLPCVRTEESYENEIKVILKDSKMRVVVLFTSKDDTMGLLRAAKRLNMQPGRLTWFGSTGWGNLNLKAHGLENIALGAITLIYPAPGQPPDGFKRHFLSLNPSNTKYKHFIDYWEAVFNCSVPGQPNKMNRRNCTGKERLQDGFEWYPYTNVQPVFDAVLAAFRAFYRKMPFCPPIYAALNLCLTHALAQAGDLLTKVEGSVYESMPSERKLTFDSRGGFIGRYDLLNYGFNSSGNKYRRIGSWEALSNITTNGKLAIADDLIYWPNSNKAPVSVCSQQCTQAKGEIRVSDMNERLRYCCWTCSKCKYNQKIENNTCVACPAFQIPNTVRDSCVMLPEVTVRYSSSIGIIILCFSFLGCLGATFTAFLFVYFYSSAIVKASGRESSSIMLTGIYLCFISPIVFLATPSITSCGIQRFIAGLSFSVMYASLLLKTNRIFRIFQSAKTTTSRPSLISPLSQIMISLGIILVQVLLGVVWIIGDHPTVQRSFPKSRDKYILFCKSDPYTMVLNLLICLAIMIACTYYAFRTRYFPKNYNESKSIMYTLYFSCFAWGIFLPTYLLSSDEESFFRTYTIAVFCITIGFISLIGFFGPKAHLILRKGAVRDGPQTGTIMFSQKEVAGIRKDNLKVIVVGETESQVQNSPDVKSSRLEIMTQWSEMHNSNGDVSKVGTEGP